MCSVCFLGITRVFVESEGCRVSSGSYELSTAKRDI